MAAKLPIILIVDDQPHIALTLEYLVRSLGNVQVVIAQDGSHAIETALKLRPALVLLDVMMPQMDGFTAAREIRAGWGEHHGEIWFISARGSRTDYEHAKSLGADRYLTKPFDPDVVLREVKNLLSRWQPADAA